MLSVNRRSTQENTATCYPRKHSSSAWQDAFYSFPTVALSSFHVPARNQEPGTSDPIHNLAFLLNEC